MREVQKSATIVFGDDGVSIVSAFKRVQQFDTNQAGVEFFIGQRDVDLTGAEIKANFGASIDDNLREIRSTMEAAQAQVADLSKQVTDVTAERDAAAAERDALKSDKDALQTSLDSLSADHASLQAQMAQVAPPDAPAEERA